jgi:hypothetical protein
VNFTEGIWDSGFNIQKGFEKFNNACKGNVKFYCEVNGWVRSFKLSRYLCLKPGTKILSEVLRINAKFTETNYLMNDPNRP